MNMMVGLWPAGRSGSGDDGGGVEAVEAAPDLGEGGRRAAAAGDDEEDPLQLPHEVHEPPRRRQQQREGQQPDAQLQDEHRRQPPTFSASLLDRLPVPGTMDQLILRWFPTNAQ